ncbi:MAG TPA: glycosyltransferase family 2 protein, partial [Gemmatimonadaceae bacterium]|nr:glycosyltransferase family 2 protein [Gemmatimonadaceae bacterium]
QTLAALQRLAEALNEDGIAMEIVAVDDASTDSTAARLREGVPGLAKIRVASHPRNRGKGAAIRTARGQVSGEIVVIQDADLEYDPSDIPLLIQPIVNGFADSVLGTRFGGSGPHRVLYFWHRLGNGGLTLLSNMFTNLNVTDMETGYKAFTRDAFLAMHLTNNRFGIEPEMLARLSQMGARVYEVPVSYYGRTYAEGKKITWRDGVAAIYHILRAALTGSRQQALPRPARGVANPTLQRKLTPVTPQRAHV